MSERDRFSLIGHAAMPLMNPLALDELLSLLEPAALQRGEAVLDLGGGRADLARICVERFGCVATCVDRSPGACDAARERAGTIALDVVCQDARAYLERSATRDIGLVAALGALHAFGSGLPSWTSALDTLRPRARFTLVGDLVARGPAAANEMDVATMEQVTPLLTNATAHVVLPPNRVFAYERAWCEAIERYLAAHPNDPRAEWAVERIAWSRAPRRARAWAQLTFVAMLVRGSQSARNA